MLAQVFKVLIVDDSNLFRQIARQMIEANFNTKIHEASNAFEAMRILGNNPIDIILLDVNMPEVDGFKAAKVIKHQEKYSKIPIIFCTAMPPTKEVVQQSFDVGGIDFLNKPFTEQDLVRILGLYFRFIIREREITRKLVDNEAQLRLEIEERKEVQKALLASENRFRKISSSAQDAIVMIDDSNHITFWNEAATRIFGYNTDEVNNFDFIKLISPPGKYQFFKITFQNMKQSGKDQSEVRHFELTGIRKGGIEIDLEISISSVEIESKINYIIIARDITIRKKADMLLQKSEAMLADAEATAHIGSWEYDINSGKSHWSKELYHIFGIDPKQTIPDIQLINSMIYEDEVVLFKNAIENTISTGTPYLIDIRIHSGDGKEKYVEGKGRAIFSSDGKVIRMVGTFMDITQKKIAQQKMDDYLKELTELNATKDKFFSIIAHDLRNPFGALKNLTEIMSDMYDDFSEEERIELLAEMKNTSYKLFKLLENLLTWSRSQRGIIQFVPEEVYFDQLVSNCYKLLSDNAKQKSIRLVNNVPKDIFFVCDNNMITTVVRNLVSNAIKFTPNDGSITVNYNKIDNKHKISIEDTGIGISPDDIIKLFRLDVSHTTIGTSSEKGSGLGLILCKEFVEKHNGTIWVESELNVGSKFIFTIADDIESIENNVAI